MFEMSAALTPVRKFIRSTSCRAAFTYHHLSCRVTATRHWTNASQISHFHVREWAGTCFNDRKPVDDDDPTIARCQSGYFRPGLLLQGVTMFNVAEILSLPQSRNLLGTIVSDHTGLQGRYDLRLEFAFPPLEGPPTVVAPSLESAIREQWGLKIEKASGPFKLVTIESAEHPTEKHICE